jgi:hypothetical protein
MRGWCDKPPPPALYPLAAQYETNRGPDCKLPGIELAITLIKPLAKIHTSTAGQTLGNKNGRIVGSAPGKINGHTVTARQIKSLVT